MVPTMELDEFLRRRREEVEWLTANGFDNGDPETNGEYRTVEHLAPFCDVFIDVGANVGQFCDRVLAAGRGQHILAFEPNPELLPALQAKLEGRGTAHQVALSDTPGTASFQIHPRDSTASSLFHRTEMMPSFSNAMRAIEVPVATLDQYVPAIQPHVHERGLMLKVDTEGAELAVIRGAVELVRLPCPQFIMFEYSFGWTESRQTLKDAFHLLDASGFSMYRVLPLGVEQIKFYFEPTMGNARYCNYLAVKGFDLGRAFAPSRPIVSASGAASLFPFNG